MEDDYHAFALCPQVINSWTTAGLNHILMHILPKFNNIVDLLLDICSKEDQDIAGRIAALVWCVWQHRNATVWNNLHSSSEQIGGQAFQLWKNWFDVHQSRTHVQTLQTAQHIEQWRKPHDGWLKINVDA
ncbi:hypothetical protein L195_g059463, partial [Trifolium pratense]